MLKTLDQNCENISEIAEEQANEIIELLGSNEDSLTPEDFMNIMTSNTSCPKNIEDVLWTMNNELIWNNYFYEKITFITFL